MPDTIPFDSVITKKLLVSAALDSKQEFALPNNMTSYPWTTGFLSSLNNVRGNPLIGSNSLSESG